MPTLDEVRGKVVIISRFTGSYRIVVGDDGQIHTVKNDINYTLSNTIGFDVTVVDDLKAIDEPYTKISAYYPSRVVDETFWVERFGDRCSIAAAGFGWVDIMPIGTSKARALSAVLELLGIAPRNIVAFGDARNDLEMLQMAGTAVVMGDGMEKAKAVADYIAEPTYADGIMKTLKKFGVL